MENRLHADYALGSSEGELRLLIRQSALYADLTEALLCNAGIGQGMRVLMQAASHCWQRAWSAPPSAVLRAVPCLPMPISTHNKNPY